MSFLCRIGCFGSCVTGIKLAVRFLAVILTVVFLNAALLTSAFAEDFSLPKRYWPEGFSWHDHHFSGWTGASVFRSGRTNPHEYPVIVFNTYDVSPSKRPGGIMFEDKQWAEQYLTHYTRKGPVAASVRGASCWETYSSEDIFKGRQESSVLQFVCMIGKICFSADLRSQSNTVYKSGKTVFLNEAIPLASLHKVATAIVSGYRQYALDNKLLINDTPTSSQNPKDDLPIVENDSVVMDSGTPPEEITPGTTAVVALTAGGIAAGGALAMLGMSGVGRREIVDSVRDLVNGEPLVDEFEAWKEKYEAMGWRYSEENGIADFEPVDGAVNEGGWVYSSERGSFIPPEGERPEPELQPEFNDGDVNPDTDEVWSDEDGGWVGRNLYAQEKARAGEIAAIEARSEEAMQAEDEKTRDLGRKVTDAERQRRDIAKVFDARRTLEDAIHQIWQQDVKDGVLDERRRALLAKLELKAEQISMRKDRTGAIEDALGLANIIVHQARNGFKVTYTYRDAVFDTTIQTGAAILDAVVTRGYASSVVGSGLAMRDAARDGKGGAEILYEGVKAAAFDFAIGKAADVVGGALRVTNTVWREAGEAVEEAAKVTRKLDGVVHGGSDLLTQTERNLNHMRDNLSFDVKGRPRAKLDDVLEIQRNPHQVRNLKGTGSQELQNGFNNTLRSDVYKPHDKALIQRIKAANPDLADKKLVVHEFRTPGKSGSGINTDRDFRMLYKNDKGEWLEVPRKKWEKQSNEIFAELTGYDPKKCPAGIPDNKKLEWWAEQHGHTPTDRSFREACPDYSDQMLNQAGERVRVGKPRIQELKELADPEVIIKGKPDNPLRLRDPVSIGSQFDEKIATNMRRGDSFEAVAQAKKGVETLEKVRTAYSKQKMDAGVLPERFSKAMNLIKKSNLPSHPDPATLRNFNDNLQQLGFADLDTFGKALSGQFESLKYAK